MGALVLHKVPDCPQIQNTNIIWVQKGAHIKLIRNAMFPEPSICLSNVPENKPPPGSPLRPLWRELPISRAVFNISLKFLINVLLIKKILPFSQKP